MLKYNKLAGLGAAAVATFLSHTVSADTQTPESVTLDGKPRKDFSVGVGEISGCDHLSIKGCHGDRTIVTIKTPGNSFLECQTFKESEQNVYFDRTFSAPYGKLHADMGSAAEMKGWVCGIGKEFTLEIGKIRVLDTLTLGGSISVGAVNIKGGAWAEASGELYKGTQVSLGNITLSTSAIPSYGQPSRTLSEPGISKSIGGGTVTLAPVTVVTPALNYGNGTASYSGGSVSSLSANWSNLSFSLFGHSFNVPAGSAATKPVAFAGSSAAMPQITLPASYTIPKNIKEQIVKSYFGGAKSEFGEGRLGFGTTKALSHVLFDFEGCGLADSKVTAGAHGGIVIGTSSLKGSAADLNACFNGSAFVPSQGSALSFGLGYSYTFLDFAYKEAMKYGDKYAAEANALVASRAGQITALASNFLETAENAVAAKGKNYGLSFTPYKIASYKLPVVTGSELVNDALGFESPYGHTISANVGLGGHVPFVKNLTYAIDATVPVAGNKSLRKHFGAQLNLAF